MKTITIKIQVPDWVSHIAMDENGAIHGWESTPVASSDNYRGLWTWGKNTNKLGKRFIGRPVDYNQDWQQSLRKV